MWMVSAVSTLTAILLVSSLLIRSHRVSIREQLQATAASLVSLGISNFSELKDFEELNDFIEDALQMDKADRVVRIFDAKGHLVFSTGYEYDQLPATLPENIEKPHFVTMSDEKGNYETLVMPFHGEGKKKQFFMQIATRLPKYSEILSTIWWQFVLLLAGVFGFSLVVSRVLAKRLSLPVVRIAEHLTDLDPNHIEAWKPIPLDPKAGYLKAIVVGINLLTQRTRTAVMQIRKMSRYVAHEMRTPLTILQGEAETVLLKADASQKEYGTVLQSSLEEVHRMSEIVDTVLSVGESSRAKALYQPVSLDLAPWLEHHQNLWEKTLGRTLVLNLPTPLPIFPTVYVDEKLLFRLIDNLIRNVGKHAPPTSSCVMSLRLLDEGLLWTLEDEGKPLPQPLVDAMNNPEAILESSGVGLHLCHSIAELCSIQLKFIRRPQGGLKVTLLWPN